MAYPRHILVPPGEPGTFHCVSRCVRRAFLCGDDPFTGRSFEHRRAWLEERLLSLVEAFAVDLYAYAVMSNHVHVVVHVDPGVAHQWSDEEVAVRWLNAFRPAGLDVVDLEARTALLARNPERVAVLRERLGSLSWFMRALKEPIARRANREDGCTGRFWEGRFRCQALLDDAAWLSAMTYVDLNPLRAGLCDSPDRAPFTSAASRRRLQNPAGLLRPVAGSARSTPLPLTNRTYLDLLAFTAGCSVRSTAPRRALRTLGLDDEQWRRQVNATESAYWRAIGRAEALLDRAQALGQRWLCGVRFAQALRGP